MRRASSLSRSVRVGMDVLTALGAVQCEGKDGPGADGTLDRHAAIHRFDQVFDDRKTEAGATELARAARVDAVEALENPRKMLGRNPWPRVSNRDAHMIVLRSRVDTDGGAIHAI